MPGTSSVDSQNGLERVEQLTTEGLVGVSHAARMVGTFRCGKPTHPSTVTRWMLTGVTLPGGRRLRLEHLRLNGRLVTSRPALLRFIAAQQTDVPPEREILPRSPTQRRHRSQNAGSELDRAWS